MKRHLHCAAAANAARLQARRSVLPAHVGQIDRLFSFLLKGIESGVDTDCPWCVVSVTSTVPAIVTAAGVLPAQAVQS
jgi:hypothetical protein